MPRRSMGPAPVAQAPNNGAPARGGLLAKVGGSRNGAILAAGATVAAVAVLGLLKGKKSTADTGTATIQPSGFDSSAYDLAEQWQSQFEGLQGQINGLQNPPPPTPTPTPKPPKPAPIPKPMPLPSPVPRPPAPRPPTKLAPTPVFNKPPPKVVRVKRGDTLSGIAQRNHISLATLKRLNPVYWTNAKYRQGNRIFAGDRVTV